MTGLMWCGHLGMYHVILMTFLCSSLFCSQLNVYAAVNGDWVDTVSDASTASTVRDSYQLRWRNSLDDGNINNLDDTLYSINKQHLLYAQHAAQKEQESNRSFHLQQSLQHLKGVYHDKTTQSHMIEKLNLQRTVMVLVMQAPKGSPQYNIYFRNFICFAKQYQYDVLVYILRPHKKPYAEFLESLGENMLYSSVLFVSLYSWEDQHNRPNIIVCSPLFFDHILISLHLPPIITTSLLLY